MLYTGALSQKNSSSLLRAFLVYVRPILEHNSILWSPYYKQDIEAIECVQRRFTKRLPGLRSCTYFERLKLLSITSLELRRLYTDLIWCYKIVFGIVPLSRDELFKFSDVGTRGHGYKLSKTYCASTVRYWFFTQRVVNVWNNLPQDIVDFTSIVSFKRTIKLVDFSAYLKVLVH